MPTSREELRRLRRLVDGFAGKRILVLGDFMLDQYIRGAASRLSPEAPVPVVAVSQESFVPGGGGNVAANLSALSARAVALGVVGDDEAGGRLAAELGRRGVFVDHLLADRARVTSQKCRVIAERQQAVRYDRETAGPLSRQTERRLLERLPAALSGASALVVSDYGKGVICPRIFDAAIALARRRGIPVTVDPKVEHFKRYKGVTCITPNTQEAWAGMHLAPQPGEAALERLGRAILKTLRCHSVLVTRGPDGMSLFNSKFKPLHIPTQAREVFDVTGAGDTVIAALTLALAAGATIRQAAEISNHAAGIVVGKLGTATTTVSELKRALG